MTHSCSALRAAFATQHLHQHGVRRPSRRDTLPPVVVKLRRGSNREFIASAAALLVSPRRSWAQVTRSRLGFLPVGDGSGQAPNYAELALLDGLRNHGWIDGRNLIIEYRFGQLQDRLSVLAAELVALTPDLVIVAGPQAAVAMKSATVTIPILYSWLWAIPCIGLVRSLSRPGGNITGLTTNVPEDFLGKRMEILREIVPFASKSRSLSIRATPPSTCPAQPAQAPAPWPGPQGLQAH